MNNALVQSNNDVYSFLESSLARQQEQGTAMQMMLSQMKKVEANVLETAAKVEVLAKEIRDENRLLPSEIDELFQATVSRSIELTKMTPGVEESQFTPYVGKYRKLIWRKMNKHFGVSKYIHIKRIDFENAIEFAKSFDPKDYI
ncbi:ORF6C domain-containing protein [Paenibacillus alvei]|uniref:ORF6C domain-containing protein n=1 Tax=Paenibacillus alvei TaxID=44250 RepID=UPI002283833E|nr:ORF6C domain-containing protein [Paenibacillus alvei]MCY9542666.1 ORF6C domain-containing protein [Paenibacillus alvei]